MIGIMPTGLAVSRPSGLIMGALSRPMSRPATVKGNLYESRLAHNLRRLIAHEAGGSVNAWCAANPPLKQSTINKLVNGTRDASVSVLEDIEDATGYSAWQLLHPDFDPRRMPPMADARALRVAAIYAGIKEPMLRDKAEAIMEQFAPDQPEVTAGGTTPALTRNQ